MSDSSHAHWKNWAWCDNLGLTPYADLERSGVMEIVQAAKSRLLCKITNTGASMAPWAEVAASAEDNGKKVKDALNAWVKNPTCLNTDNKLSSRSAATQLRGHEMATMVKRDQPVPSSAVVQDAWLRRCDRRCEVRRITLIQIRGFVWAPGNFQAGGLVPATLLRRSGTRGDGRLLSEKRWHCYGDKIL